MNTKVQLLIRILYSGHWSVYLDCDSWWRMLRKTTAAVTFDPKLSITFQQHHNGHTIHVQETSITTLHLFFYRYFDLECIKQLYMQVKCLSENSSTNSLTEPIVYILTGVTDHLVIVLANIFNFMTITGNKQKWLSNYVQWLLSQRVA